MLRKYGLCVSMGETTGRAYVLQSDEIEEKLTGDTILILKQLDRKILVDLPSNVVGIVAEKGNIGSHGAGILRKQRIPCVVRIADATATIPNGVMVSLIGKDNEIIYEATESEGGSSSEEAKGVKQFSYKNISKRKVTLENIQRIETQTNQDQIGCIKNYDLI